MCVCVRVCVCVCVIICELSQSDPGYSDVHEDVSVDELSLFASVSLFLRSLGLRVGKTWNLGGG